MNKNTYSFIERNTKILFIVLSALVLLLAFLYVYFINFAIHKTALREDVRIETMDLQSKTSNLEKEYLALQREITKDFALRNGFVDVEETVFVSIPNTQLSLHE